jgi:uncharacterized protein YcbK (DUF882 family)
VAALLAIFFGSAGVRSAAAETRTIAFHHIHTKEDLVVTYKRNGRYDEEALKQINHLMRDWREQEPTRMDPAVIDLLWEVHREVGAKEPIWVVCGYRSPDTNAQLRRRSSGVAKFSHHMSGKAIDFYIPGVPIEQVRAAGLRAQRGGVGIYPSSGFVHMDTGNVRHWPRMPEEQLARVMAKGQLASRSASDDRRSLALAQAAPTRKPAFLAKLFGGGEEAEQETRVAAAAARSTATAASEKPAEKIAAKPTEKTVPLPAARLARVDGQLALATSKPKPAGIQLASAEPAIAVVAAGADTTSPSEAGGREDTSAASPGKSANDIIKERANWQGPANMEPVEAAKAGPTRITSSPRRQTAVAGDGVVTASVAPSWPLADRKGEELLPSALAYAAQPDPIAVARPLPMGSGNTRAAPPAQGDTTIAVKRSDDRPTATMPRVMPPRPGTNAVQTGDRFDDPWMRVMIVSPSAQSFMRVTLLGAQDFRKLGPHLLKPASVVMMTFSDDPHLGMSSEKFSGAAVVFVATITFRPGRTAALR